MPDKSWSILLWLKELKNNSRERHWLEPVPVYAATVMVLVAAVLMLAVAGGVRYSTGKVPEPRPAPSVAAGRQEAPATVAAPAPAPAVSVSQETKPDKHMAQPARTSESPRRPVSGEIAPGFGWQQHPVYLDWRFHTGIDIKTPENVPVLAMLAGEVSAVYEDRNVGLTVVVKSGPYSVYYASLSSVALNKGEQVESGTRVGNTGSAPSEPFPHLHLAVKKEDKYIDPEELLNKAK